MLFRSLLILEQLVSEGKDVSNIVVSLVRHFRSIMFVKILHPDEISMLSGDNPDKMEQQGRQLSKEEIIFILDLFTDIQGKLRYAFSPRVLIELGIFKICSRAKYQILIPSPDKDRKKPEELPKTDAGVKVSEVNKSEIAEPGPNERPDKKSPDLIQEIKLIWSDVVKTLKQKKMSLASCLLDAKVSAFEGGVLILEVNTESNLHSEILEDRDNKKLIEDVLYDKLAVKVTVKCRTNRRAHLEKKNKVREILKNPKLKKISMMLNAKVLEVIPENEN